MIDISQYLYIFLPYCNLRNIYLLFHNVAIIFILCIIGYIIYKRKFWQSNKVKIMDRIISTKSFKNIAESLPEISSIADWNQLYNFIQNEISNYLQTFLNIKWTNPNNINRVVRGDEITKTLYMKIMYLISKTEDLGLQFPHDLMQSYHNLSSYIIKVRVIYQFRLLKKEAIGQALDRALIYEESLGEIKSWMSKEINYKNLKRNISSFHWLILYFVDELFLHLNLFEVVNANTQLFFHNLIDWFYTTLRIHIILYISVIFHQLIFLLLRSILTTDTNLFPLLNNNINSSMNSFVNNSANMIYTKNNSMITDNSTMNSSINSSFNMIYTKNNPLIIGNISYPSENDTICIVNDVPTTKIYYLLDYCNVNHSLNYNYSLLEHYNITSTFTKSIDCRHNINDIYNITLSSSNNTHFLPQDINYNGSHVYSTISEMNFTLENINYVISYMLFIIIRFFTFKDIVYLLVASIKLLIITVKKYWSIVVVSSSFAFKLIHYSIKSINFLIKILRNTYKVLFYQKLDVKKLIKLLNRLQVKGYLIYIIEKYATWIVYQFRIVLYAILLLILTFIIRGMDWINMKIVGKNTKVIFDDEQLYTLNNFYWLFFAYNLYYSSQPTSLIGKLIILFGVYTFYNLY